MTQTRPAPGPSSADTTDFDDADHGFVATLADPVITAEDGRVVWDCSRYDFLTGDAPATAHPGLWRQGQLAAKHGLYEIADGVYQVRGFDLSNMSLVETDTGVIVVDTLMCNETAAAALALYRAHRGDRPVAAVLITHSHADHFGGTAAVVEPTTPIYAPAGFLEHAVSENVYAGVAMARRATFIYAADLPAGPEGQIGAGLGQTTSNGTVSLLAPTVDVTHTGQEAVIDGVRVVFQVTPGTEAPAEMNFFFPDKRALCMAENATHTLHQILTLRGAEVRDARAWSRYLGEAVRMFGADTDVVFASHHWPTWGTERITTFLTQQRDTYAYLHDQTLRRMNQGEIGTEIAEDFTLPPALDSAWSTRGYYGSFSHNVKAVYQRYLGWYDGNPAHLWTLPPEQEATRYVAFMGGAARVLEQARATFEAGDLRWTATVVSHVVFADPTDADARELLAATLTRLGFGAENGLWRNIYLRGAEELRGPIAPAAPDLASSEVMGALTVEQLFDSVAVRLDGLRAAGETACIDWVLTDLARTYRTELSNGALIHADAGFGTREPGLTVTLTKPQLPAVLGTGSLGSVSHTGDAGLLPALLGLLDGVDHRFPMVTP
ncbi:MAG: alkyl sulfatase dimerization domain-containing protein [Pseudonocardia sediminis]